MYYSNKKTKEFKNLCEYSLKYKNNKITNNISLVIKIKK